LDARASASHAETILVPDENLIHVARGDSFIDDGEDTSLPSEVDGVTDAQWTQFVRGMICAPLIAVSASNALGMFEIMPRRLADLGIVSKLARSKSPQGRTIWVAIFVPPLTCDRFLKSPQAQYGAFTDSMCDYVQKMDSGEIEKPSETSISGALAILHRAGPKGLSSWKSNNRFPSTEKSYNRVAGLF
jgi:hypothetical protein